MPDIILSFYILILVLYLVFRVQLGILEKEGQAKVTKFAVLMKSIKFPRGMWTVRWWQELPGPNPIRTVEVMVPEFVNICKTPLVNLFANHQFMVEGIGPFNQSLAKLSEQAKENGFVSWLLESGSLKVRIVYNKEISL